jgi:hypothetical protein
VAEGRSRHPLQLASERREQGVEEAFNRGNPSHHSFVQRSIVRGI